MLQNRTVGQRRKHGVCWCCATALPVRPCTYWASGITKELCKGCEDTQPVNKAKAKPKPADQLRKELKEYDDGKPRGEAWIQPGARIH